MPSPIVIRDPACHSDKRFDPTANVGSSLVFQSFRDLISAENEATQGRNNVNNRNGDTGTSPRLLGYVFSFISSAVAFVSSIVFYFRGVEPATYATVKAYINSNEINVTIDELEMLHVSLDKLSVNFDLFLASGGVLVQDWKVYGSIIISGVITVITGLVILAHIDSFCCPNTFQHFFRDGSLSERNLILTLIVLAAISLQVSTSKFSVGEAQTNVFFSTWTNFISSILNFEVWRKTAGRHHLFQNILFNPALPLTRIWFLMSIFATIQFLATIDYFLYNKFDAAQLNWDCLSLSWNNSWIWLALGLVTLCWGSFFMRRQFKEAVSVQLVELFVVTGSVFISGFIISRFTGGRLDRITCPSNLYFAVWGTFFTGLWIFSSLLQSVG